MKELITEFKMSITMIAECDSEEMITEAIEKDRTEEMKRRFAAAVAKTLGADKAEIIKVKHFISDSKKDDMELITEVKMGVTVIFKLEDEDVDTAITNSRTESYRRLLEDDFKEALNVDKVDILNIKHFVRDLEEVEK